MSLVDQSRAAHLLSAYGPGTRLAAKASVPAEAEYHFLLGRYVDTATLTRAFALAAAWGVHPHDVLIANGWLDADDYYRALAGAAGVPFKSGFAAGDTMLPPTASPRQCLAAGLLKERAGAGRFVLAPDRLRPNALRAVLAQLGPRGFALTTPRAVRDAVHHQIAPALARNAVEALSARHPEQSARTRTARWQRAALILGGAGFLGVLLLAPIETIRAATLLLAVLFVPVIGLRVLAAYDLLRGNARSACSPAQRMPDTALPTYTILAPLFREAHMVPSLVQALTRLDWPAAKLDIKLILEAADAETVAAARALSLPGNVEIVVVPDLSPRTKPKALNYALPLARGDYVVIFDLAVSEACGRLSARHAFHGAPSIGISMVRNEQDVVERFVRHALGSLDALIVIEHGSIDATPEILAALREEGLPIEIVADKALGLHQADRLTRVARAAAALLDAHPIVPIDADEFIVATGGEDLASLLKAVDRGDVRVTRWRAYVPTSSDPADEPDLLKRPRRQRRSNRRRMPCANGPSRVRRHVQGDSEKVRGLERVRRIERPTRSLGSYCSTTELHPRCRLIQ